MGKMVTGGLPIQPKNAPSAFVCPTVSSRRFTNVESLFTYPEFKDKCAIAVSTHGSPAIIHLQLESWKRFSPEARLIVIDDCSTEGERIRALCESYGAEFVSNPTRLGHLKGDVSALSTALKLAKDAQLLVKISRRFVWCAPWLEFLRIQASCFQFPTYAQSCRTYNFPFRSECFAVHPGSWQDVAAPLASYRGGNVEQFLFELAAKVPLVRAYGTLPNAAVYQEFPGMTPDRHMRTKEFLWHDCTPPETFFALSREWRLTGYSVSDFTVIKN